ncbi:hypothetical protein ACIBCN_18525 [Nocardia sp. NPDC051052]|uniref:hypothetical protein n=1 Tax=Nocardia sp. NPDC051052 TaxID=3364322 RepID=UPI003799ECAF
MSIEFGRSVAEHRGAVARVRGGSAGAISGTISVAAHGWASGGMSPDSTTLALLVAAAAVVGALVAGLAPLRDTSAGLVTALVAGQLLGHLTMGFSSGHLHHGDAQLTPPMLSAHLLAAVVAALVIRSTEAAYRTATAALFRVLRPHRPAPVLADPAALRTAHRDRVILRVLAAASLRTRGPPFAVAS